MKTEKKEKIDETFRSFISFLFSIFFFFFFFRLLSLLGNGIIPMRMAGGGTAYHNMKMRETKDETIKNAKNTVLPKPTMNINIKHTHKEIISGYRLNVNCESKEN